MSEGFSDWEKDDAGNIKCWPMTGFQVGPAAGIYVLLRLEHFQHNLNAMPEEITPDLVAALQVLLMPDQATRLGEALVRSADKCRATSGPRN
jgi:hypothetical protein